MGNLFDGAKDVGNGIKNAGKQAVNDGKNFIKDLINTKGNKAKLAVFAARYGVKSLKYIAVAVLVGGALLFVGGQFKASANTSKKASKSAKVIASSTSMDSGGIKVEDTTYETIREDLKDSGITPESYYLGENDKCQDESGLTYLEKMVQAEIVSNYPDIGVGDIKGIIKIHRNGSPLTYSEKTDFESKVSAANSSQNSTDINNVLTLFTVDDTWNIIVATSNQTTVTDENGTTTTTYTLTTNPINYQMLVSQYTIPYEFLFVLMQLTNNPEYVSAVADLALKGEIILDIKDLTTTETITETNEWTEETVVRKTANYATTEELTTAPWESETKTTANKSTSTTTVNTLTSIDAKITKADTWAYTKDASYTQTTITHEPIDEVTELEEELGTEKVQNVKSGSEYYKEGKTLNKINCKQTYTSNTTSTSWEKGAVSEAINTKDFLGLWQNKDGKYISPYSSGYTEGINDYVSEENDGVKVRYKIPDEGMFKAPIDSILNEYESAEIFLYHLSLNERTQNVETLMRYMMYIYTGKDYGVTDEDLESLLNIYQESEFYSIDGSFTGDSLEAKIWYALKGHGYSDEQVAGVIGNLSGESGLSPNKIESGSGEGRGIAQWSFGRREKLETYAERKGVSWEDEDTQIELLIAEIKGVGQPVTEVGAQIEFQESPYSYKDKVYPADSWHKATTVEEATVAFCVTWERPDINKAHMDKRIKAAEEVYARYHGKSSGGTSTTGTGVIGGTFTSGITGKTHTYYMQQEIAKMPGKSGWKGYCNRAVAMCVISAYTDKSTNELIQEVDSFSGGIPYDSNGEIYFNKYGLTKSSQSKSNHTAALSAQLRSGGYALIHCKNNFKGKSGTKWSSAMHWVAIIGYRNEGGKEQIFVTDPWSKSNCGWYDIDEFNNNKAGFINHLIFVREK